MKHYYLIIIVLLMSIGHLHSQSNFKPGYVIKTEGDTLVGEINYRDDQYMGEVCSFRSHRKSAVIHFNAGEIEGFRFIEGKYYVSRNLKGKKVFLEFLIKGRLNMFHYRDNEDHFYLEKEGVTLTELPYKDTIIVDEYGGKHFRKTNKYVGLLSYYLNDAPNLRSEINSIKWPNHENLIKLATDYHKAVCDGEKCIIYEKKLPVFKVNLEIAGGVVKGLYDNNTTQVPKFQGGIFAHVWMPVISENLFIKAGIMYTTCQYRLYNIHYGSIFSFDQADGPIYKMPLQVEYVFTNSIISPKISAGFDIYAATNKKNYDYKAYDNFKVGPYGLSGLTIIIRPQITVGATVKLTKSLFWSVNYDIISYPGLTTGLYICF